MLSLYPQAVRFEILEIHSDHLPIFRNDAEGKKQAVMGDTANSGNLESL